MHPITALQAALVSAEQRLDQMIELPRLSELEFMHGGLRCRLVRLDLGAREEEKKKREPEEGAGTN